MTEILFQEVLENAVSTTVFIFRASRDAYVILFEIKLGLSPTFIDRMPFFQFVSYYCVNSVVCDTLIASLYNCQGMFFQI